MMTNIKATDTEMELMVLGAPYGIDRVGQEFTPETDFGDLPIVPAIYWHGWGADDGKRIGWAHKANRDEQGQWYRVVLNSSSEIARKIYEDAKRGLVRASSDALGHLVRPIEAMKGAAGKIERWVIGALSLMDEATYENAINPRAIALPALRAYFAELDTGEGVKAGAALNKTNRATINEIKKLLDELYNQFPDEERLGIKIADNSQGVKSKKMENTELKSQIESIVELKFSAAAKAEQERADRAKEENQAKIAQEAAIKAAVDAQLAAKLKEFDESAIKSGRPAIFASQTQQINDETAVKAFNDYIRTGRVNDAVKATMNETTAGQGGYLVPIKYSNELVKSLSEGSLLRMAGARVISVAGTSSFRVPALTHTSRAVKTAESAAYDQVEPTVTEIAFTPVKYTRLSKVTEELLADSRFDVFSQILVPDAAQAFAKAENDDFTVGDGSGDPQGVTVGASAGVTAAAVGAITADELIDLYHSLGYLYRQNAVWMMNDTTLKAIRKLKDTTNQYLWQPGLVAGQPDRILGRPVYTNNNMAELGASNVTVVFGDMSYFWVADFGGLEVKRLNELYAANGHVGFQWMKRYDSRVVLSAAIKKLTQAAA